MQIQVFSVTVTSKVSKAGKNFRNAQVDFKNLDTGKVDSKNITEYSKVFKLVAEAQAGQVFSVTQEKNGEFWEWTSFTRDVTGTPVNTPTAVPQQAERSGTKSTSTYSTAEERAKTQVYIIKQSSLAQAVATLTICAKIPPTTQDVLNLAQEYVDWIVYDKQSDLLKSPNDLPSDDIPY